VASVCKRQSGCVARLGEEKNNAYSVLVGNHEGKGTLARSVHRLENDIKMDREERGLGGGDWFYLAQSEGKSAHNDDTLGF